MRSRTPPTVPRGPTGSLDLLAKVAAILTPILLAAGGWYFSALSSEQDLTVKRFREASNVLGDLSTADEAKQRDTLFTLMEMERPGLLRRATAYLNTTFVEDHRQKLRGLEREKIDRKITSEQLEDKTREENARHQAHVERVFYPLLRSTIAAQDVRNTRLLIDSVPSLLSISELSSIESGLYVFLTPLDDAIDAGSPDLVAYFISKGLRPSSQSGVKAAAGGSSNILELVAAQMPKDFAVAWRTWEHLAIKGRPEQIDVLAKMRFPTGTPIRTMPVIAQAAKLYKARNVAALVRAGFPFPEITQTNSAELMAVVAENFNHDYLWHPKPDLLAVEETLLTICRLYEARQISREDIRRLQGLIRVTSAQAEVERDQVFEAVFKSGAWRVLDCLRNFYGMDKFNVDDYQQLFSAAVLADGAVERLIKEHRLPLTLTDRDGRNLVLLAAEYGKPELLPFLIRHGVDPRGTDKHGNGLFSIVLESEFVDPGDFDSPIFGMRMDIFSRLMDLAARYIDINQANADGYTPLMIAVRGGSYTKISEVLRRKPDLDRTAKDGQTALSLAAARPSLYISLYNAGARAAGAIKDCEKVVPLLAWIKENGWLYRPFNVKFEDWTPELSVHTASQLCANSSPLDKR